MKKSELRKLIREIISEQTPWGSVGLGGATSPILSGPTNNGSYLVKCPEGYRFESMDCNMAFAGQGALSGPQHHVVDGCVRIRPTLVDKDPLGDAPVGGGGFGTANLGGLPSN